MTFLNIKKAAFRRLQVNETQTGDLNTRIGGFVNQWHRQILAKPVFRDFRKIELTEATVASQHRYGVKMLEIHYITERSNDRRLRKRNEEWWRRHFPDPTADSGEARFWIPLGQTRIRKRPANASELFVISTSASDTMTIHVEAIRSGGETRLLSVAVNGTTAASLASAITDVEDILDVYLTAVAVGLVTLREDSGVGTVLSEISIGESKPRYTQFALAPRPSSVQTLFINGVARMTDLVNDFDEPLIYEDFHDILVNGAVYEEWLAHGRTKEAQWLRDEIAKGIQEMRNWAWMNFVQPESDRTDETDLFDPLRRLTLPIT